MSFLKFSLFLFKINPSFKVKFQVILNDDTSRVMSSSEKYLNSKRSFSPPFNVFTTYDGKEYYTLNPHPFITIDLIKNGDEYDAGKSLTLNRRDLYLFMNELKIYIESFVNNKGLFVYNNNKLVLVNSEIPKTQRIIKTTNKSILLRPQVIEIDNNYYEGTIFCLNSMDNYSLLTYDDMRFLYSELMKIDLNLLTLNAFMITGVCNKSNPQKTMLPKQNVSIQEVRPNEIIDLKPNMNEPSELEKF